MEIKKMRLAAGMTQIELASKMEVNQTAISQWERNVALPASEKLPGLADVLHCTIDALFGREAARDTA